MTGVASRSGSAADVDDLVAGDRGHRHALAGHLVDGDHRRLEPAAPQVLLHVGGVLADELDPHPGVSRENVGHQARAGVQPGDPEHAEPDGAALEGLDALHGLAGLGDGGQDPLGVRPQGVRDGGGDDSASDSTEQLDAQRPLEAADLFGDRRLGVPELLRRGRQRPVLVGREEAGELMWGKHREILWLLKEEKGYPYVSESRILAPVTPSVRFEGGPDVRPQLHCLRHAPAHLPRA